MNIRTSLRIRQHQARELAKQYVATHRALLEKARRAIGTYKDLLIAEIAHVYAEWQRQTGRCKALHQMLADYSSTGWEQHDEMQIREKRKAP